MKYHLTVTTSPHTSTFPTGAKSLLDILTTTDILDMWKPHKYNIIYSLVLKVTNSYCLYLYHRNQDLAILNFINSKQNKSAFLYHLQYLISEMIRNSEVSMPPKGFVNMTYSRTIDKLLIKIHLTSNPAPTCNSIIEQITTAKYFIMWAPPVTYNVSIA